MVIMVFKMLGLVFQEFILLSSVFCLLPMSGFPMCFVFCLNSYLCLLMVMMVSVMVGMVFR